MNRLKWQAVIVEHVRNWAWYRLKYVGQSLDETSLKRQLVTS